MAKSKRKSRVSEDLTDFYCSSCGSDRVAGQAMVPLNYRRDPATQAEYPTVSRDELQSIRARMSDPSVYVYFCFECDTLGHQLLDDHSLVASGKVLVS